MEMTLNDLAQLVGELTIEKRALELQVAALESANADLMQRLKQPADDPLEDARG